MTKQTYELRDGVDRVVRSGIVLEAGDTIDAYPDIEDDHDDVLRRTGLEEDSE